MQLVVIALIVLVAGVLLWTWWASRAGRDPASSVDSFNRALTAMRPLGAPDEPAELRHGISVDGASDASEPESDTEEPAEVANAFEETSPRG